LLLKGCQPLLLPSSSQLTPSPCYTGGTGVFYQATTTIREGFHPNQRTIPLTASSISIYTISMLVTVYIRKSDEALWKALPNKTAAISDLLNGTKQRQTSKPKTPAKLETFNRLKDTLDIRCKGTHYMDRTDCGREGCPWK